MVMGNERRSMSAVGGNLERRHRPVRETVDEGKPLAWELNRCILIMPASNLLSTAPCLNVLQKSELFIGVGVMQMDATILMEVG